MEEGNWRVRYTDSVDLIKKVIRGIPKLVDGIRIRQEEMHQSPSPKPEIFPNIYGPRKGIEVNLGDVSEQTIKKYANVIRTSSNADVKNVAWRYLGKLVSVELIRL
jgi:hypothetical protein